MYLVGAWVLFLEHIYCITHNVRARYVRAYVHVHCVHVTKLINLLNNDLWFYQVDPKQPHEQIYLKLIELDRLNYIISGAHPLVVNIFFFALFLLLVPARDKYYEN